MEKCISMFAFRNMDVPSYLRVEHDHEWKKHDQLIEIVVTGQLMFSYCLACGRTGAYTTYETREIQRFACKCLL